MTDPQALAEHLGERAAAGDASPETIAALLDAFASDAAWWEENPYYDGLSDRGWAVHLWESAAKAIERLGEPAVEALAARIERDGDARLLYRAAKLGPRIVALAMTILEAGRSEALASAAAYVLARNEELFGPADAVVNFLLAFDQHVPEPHVVGDLLVETWPKLATPAGRAAVLARWGDGSLRAWIEARLDAAPHRTRHLVALLAVVPFEEALPLLQRAFATHAMSTVFEPLLVIDPARARAVIERDGRVRAWALELARRLAAGGWQWDGPRLDRPTDHALVALFADDREVHDALIADTERAGEIWWSQWRALAAHVRHDPARRFARAAAAAIYKARWAGGPGDPIPRFALAAIAEIDPPRMVRAVLDELDAVKRSRCAWCFLELFGKLGAHAAIALPALQQWAREAPADHSVREELAKLIGVLSARGR